MLILNTAAGVEFDEKSQFCHGASGTAVTRLLNKVMTAGRWR
jgi:hypothetical protein